MAFVGFLSLFADVVAVLAVRLDVVAAVAGGTAHFRPHSEAHVVVGSVGRYAAVVVAAVAYLAVVGAVVGALSSFHLFFS